MPLKLFDVGDTLKPREIIDHPAVRLVRHINPVETPTIFFQQLYADLLSEGNHFSWLDMADGVPINMIRMPPEEIEVVPSKTRIIDGYVWKRADGSREFYSVDQVMHVRTRNPASIYRGIGLLVRLREQILFDRSLRQWKLAQFKNGIPTSIVFKMKKAFTDDADLDRFREQTWGRLRGVNNAGKPMFVKADDVDIEVLPRPSENEIAWQQSIIFTRNEFAMLFGVPPSRLSDYSESFRANASEQARTYWQDTIMAWHRLVLDYLNSIFLPRYFSTSQSDPKVRFAYDYSQIRALALSMRDMATVNEMLIRNGMRTPNEAAISMGDAAHDDEAADDLYMNGRPLGDTSVPLSMPGTQPSGGESRPEGEGGDGGEDIDRGATVGVGAGRIREPKRPVLRAVPGDIVNEEDERKRMARAVDGLIAEMVRRAGEEEIELAGLLGSFDAKDPLVLEAIRTQAVLVSEAVVNTTASEVRRAVAEAIEGGLDPDNIRKAIRNKFKTMRADWRLDRISRTEVHQAHEMGGFHALKQNGVTMKRWVSARLPTTRHDERADHLALDGAVVPVDAPFIDPQSGAQLMFPGDTANAVSGADVINCLCVKVADFSDITGGELGFHRNIDPTPAYLRKKSTRNRFEASFKLQMRRSIKGIEDRAMEELDRQLTVEKSAAPIRALGRAS